MWSILFGFLTLRILGVEAAASSQSYTWANVHTGASGGFVSDFISFVRLIHLGLKVFLVFRLLG
jgi:hypothetical protein